MPVETKPLFRPDVLRPHLSMFDLPGHLEATLPKLEHWAALLRSHKADAFKEQELLPDFFTDFFCELLGYTRPVAKVTHCHVKSMFGWMENLWMPCWVTSEKTGSDSP